MENGELVAIKNEDGTIPKEEVKFVRKENCRICLKLITENGGFHVKDTKVLGEKSVMAAMNEIFGIQIDEEDLLTAHSPQFVCPQCKTNLHDVPKR